MELRQELQLELPPRGRPDAARCAVVAGQDVKSATDHCPFCSSSLSTSDSPFDVEIARGPSLRLLPALGMLVPGYLLATTLEHHLSFADLEPAALDYAGRWLKEIVDSLMPFFGRYLIFEHGSCPSSFAGACVDHAHVHLVPLANELESALLGALDWEELPSFKDIGNLRDTPYVYLGLGDRHYIVRDPAVPSQWLRRGIAAHLGHDRWDWAIDDGREALRITQSRLLGTRFP